jgi:hypothetical protein
MSAAETIVDELIQALQKRPDTFTAGEYTLDDKNTGMSFWIANGRFSAGVHHPFNLQFGAWQSWKFHRALTRWKAWYAVKKLREGKK